MTVRPCLKSASCCILGNAHTLLTNRKRVNGNRYQNGSFSLINVGSGFSRLRGFFFFFFFSFRKRERERERERERGEREIEGEREREREREREGEGERERERERERESARERVIRMTVQPRKKYACC